MFVVIGIFFPAEDAFLISVDQIINSLLVVNSLVSFNNIHDYKQDPQTFTMTNIHYRNQEII